MHLFLTILFLSSLVTGDRTMRYIPTYYCIPEAVCHLIAAFEPMLFEADRSLIGRYSQINPKSAEIARKLKIPKLAYIPHSECLEPLSGIEVEYSEESIPIVMAFLGSTAKHTAIAEYVWAAIAEEVFSLLLHEKTAFNVLLTKHFFDEDYYSSFENICDYFHKKGRFDRAVRLYLAITGKSMKDREDGPDKYYKIFKFFSWPSKISPELVDFVNRKPHMLQHLCKRSSTGLRLILESNITIDELASWLDKMDYHCYCRSWNYALLEYLSSVENEELQKPLVREKIRLVYEVAKKENWFQQTSLLDNALILRGFKEGELTDDWKTQMQLAKPAALAKRYDVMMALIRNSYCHAVLELVKNHTEFIAFAQDYFSTQPLTAIYRPIIPRLFFPGHPEFIASLFGYRDFTSLLINGSVDQLTFAVDHVCDYGDVYQIKLLLGREFAKDRMKEILRSFITRLLKDSPRNDKETMETIYSLLKMKNMNWAALWAEKYLVEISFKKLKLICMNLDLLNLIFQRNFNDVFYLSLNVIVKLLDDDIFYHWALKHKDHFNRLFDIEKDARFRIFTPIQLKRLLALNPKVDKAQFCRMSIHLYFIDLPNTDSFTYLLTKFMHYLKVWKEANPKDFAEVISKKDVLSRRKIADDEQDEHWDHSSPERSEAILQIFELRAQVGYNSDSEDFRSI